MLRVIPSYGGVPVIYIRLIYYSTRAPEIPHRRQETCKGTLPLPPPPLTPHTAPLYVVSHHAFFNRFHRASLLHNRHLFVLSTGILSENNFSGVWGAQLGAVMDDGAIVAGGDGGANRDDRNDDANPPPQQPNVQQVPVAPGDPVSSLLLELPDGRISVPETVIWPSLNRD